MDNQKNNIVGQVNRDFINIDSVEEFAELLEDFPEDPALHRAYADILVKKKFSEKAALSYGRAAALYLISGKLIPGVLTKLFQWRIKSPVYRDAQLFLTALNENSLPETPFKIFLDKLSKP